MADTYSINDVNRAIRLDVLGLDNWFEELKNYFDIDSDEINEIINDSTAYENFKTEVEADIKAKDEEYSDWFGSDLWQGDIGEETEQKKKKKKYYKAKEIYEEANNTVRKLVKFDQELDEIIKNVSKAKGINEIEDEFSLDSIKEALEQIKDGTYNGLTKEQIQGYSVMNPGELLKYNLGGNTSKMSNAGGEFLKKLEGNDCFNETGKASALYVVDIYSEDGNYCTNIKTTLGGDETPTFGDGRVTFGYGTTFASINKGIKYINDNYNTNFSYPDNCEIPLPILEQLMYDRIKYDQDEAIAQAATDYGHSVDEFTQNQYDALVCLTYLYPATIYDSNFWTYIDDNGTYMSSEDFNNIFGNYFGGEYDSRLEEMGELYEGGEGAYTYDPGL